jgi:hypothetical protein
LGISESMGKYGKNIRIAFRISSTAKDRLNQVADLFQLEPSQVAKAILYMHLGVFEPIDQRRRSWREKKKRKRVTTYIRNP